MTNIEFGKAGEVEDITKMVKGIVSYEFPKPKSLAEYSPPYEKKEVAFK